MKLLAWYLALVSLVAVAVGLGGAGVGDPAAPVSDRPGRFVLPDVELASAGSLRGFADCDELLGYFREEAPRVTRRLGGEFDTADEMVTGEVTEADSPIGAPVTEQAATADGFSGTNVQEVDVDEPDTVKTDGELIVAVAGTELHVVDPAPEGPRLQGAVALPSNGSSELLLTGDLATVLTRSYGTVRADDRSVPDASTSVPVQHGSQTIVTTVDLGDPRTPRVVETATFEGDYVSARMTGTMARIVLRSSPLVMPGELDTAGIDAWLPNDEDGPIVACDAVSRPAEPAGVGTVTVLTVDVAASLTPIDATAVVADAETVYASTERLYVATTNGGSGCCFAEPLIEGPMPIEPIPVEPDGGIGDTPEGGFTPGMPAPAPQPEPISTDIHAFDTTGAATPYLGSGRVEGRLLNSFALSEHEGTLRVATTVEPFDGSRPSESAVITLAEEAGGLVERGRLAGLGTTEQIYAVRYQGDVAYVVTFRRTDPLYTLDLSDPADPRLLGELKIPGYSAYLHPAEAGRLIGVGQDATDQGLPLGAQVSTFDVADLTAPAEEDRLTFPGGHSAAEHEHRAFLWWAQDRVAIVPLEQHRETTVDELTSPLAREFTGAVAVDVATDGTLTERGRVTHQDRVVAGAWAPITRSLVIGDRLYTLSETGVLASDLDTLADAGWLAL